MQALDTQGLAPGFFIKIKNQEQIDTLKALGIREVICVPEKSDRLPLAPKAALAPAAAAEPSVEDPYLQELWRQKKERIALLKQRREAFQRTEEAYNQKMEKLPALIRISCPARPRA